MQIVQMQLGWKPWTVIISCVFIQMFRYITRYDGKIGINDSNELEVFIH